MGCYPLGKMLSRALEGRNGKERRRWRQPRTVLMSPPPTCSHARSMVKTVTFSDNNTVIIIPPEPTTTTSGPDPHHEPVVSPSPHASGEAAEANAQARPAAAGAEAHGSVPYGWSSGRRYMTSPLPGWEDGDRRRREYFGGEYRYYPTPVREGMYDIATDANYLTSVLSEENPNACSIV